MSDGRIWAQRGVVAGLWPAILLMWRQYQTSNDRTSGSSGWSLRSTTDAGQRLIGATEAAWSIFAYVGSERGAPVDAAVGERRSFVATWSARLRDNSFETVFIMRLVFLPSDLVNSACGALRIRWAPFLLATALGSLPGTISFVLLGASLERVDQGIDGINPWAVVAGVTIFVIGIVVSRVLGKQQT